MQEKGVRITSEPAAPESDAQLVREGLYRYNVGRTGYDFWRPVKLLVRDDKGYILGGLLGDIWGGWIHIDVLWIEEALRGTGVGRRLVEMAEAEAREHGARYVHLDSHSFQAPGFYEKLGYTEFGKLEDAPLGHTQHFLWKRL